MEAVNQKIRCPICGFYDAGLYLIKKDYKFYRSENCGLIFIWPTPNLNKTELIYKADYFTGAKQGYGYVNYDRDKEPMKKTFIKYLGLIEKYNRHKDALLDVGAATGFFMDLVRKRGWKTKGIEISEYAVKEARKKGLDVIPGILENASFRNDSFDAITMWDVLEHLSDPLKIMKIVNSILKKGGILAINTPDSASLWARLLGRCWYLLIPPEHIFLFSKKALHILLENNGFEILEIRKIGKSFTFPYILGILYSWQRLRLWKKLLELFQNKFLNKMSVPINFRDNVFIIARKI